MELLSGGARLGFEWGSASLGQGSGEAGLGILGGMARVVDAIAVRSYLKQGGRLAVRPAVRCTQGREN